MNGVKILQSRGSGLVFAKYSREKDYIAPTLV